MKSTNNIVKKTVLVAVAAIALSVNCSFAGWLDSVLQPPPRVHNVTVVAAVRG